MFFERLPEFVSNHFFLAALFTVLVLVLIRSEFVRFTRRFKMISTAQLVQLINRENGTVLDVSSLADFEVAHIAGARHIAPSEFNPENKELVKVRESPVVVVCRNGSTAQTVCARLDKVGFKQLYCLEGGMGAWLAADMPVIKGKN